MRNFARTACIAVAVSLCACGGQSSADESQAQNITAPPDAVVDPGLYRGPRPTVAELKHLASIGVKTIIDLEDDDDAIAAEQPVATSLGINFISQPMSGFWTPNDDQVDQIEASIADPTLRPMFVHCELGEDRTGIIIGIHRVEHDGWTPKAANKELLAKGFHTYLILLKAYFDEKTGY